MDSRLAGIQVEESFVLGADALLLIACLLRKTTTKASRPLPESWNLFISWVESLQ